MMMMMMMITTNGWAYSRGRPARLITTNTTK